MSVLGNQGIKLSILLHLLLNAGKSRNLTVSQTPSAIKALKGQAVIINCSYSNENGEQLRIKWGRKDSAQGLCDYTYNKNNAKYTLWHCVEHANITVDISTNSSSLTIYDLYLKDSSIYFCQVFIEIPPPALAAKGKGTHLTVEASPTVRLRAETLPSPNEGVQLICTSLEFYPESIQVSWFKDGWSVTNGSMNGTLCANSDGSFSITSFLNLSLFDWNEGGNYSCQVNHSTLSAPITERISVSNQDEKDSRRSTWAIVLRVTILATATLIVMAVFILYFRLHKKPLVETTITLEKVIEIAQITEYTGKSTTEIQISPEGGVNQKGLFRYKRLPFGITASTLFKQSMGQILSGLQGMHGLPVRKVKCDFFQTSVQYLGHVINSKSLLKAAKKMETITEAPRPTNGIDDEYEPAVSSGWVRQELRSAPPAAPKWSNWGAERKNTPFTALAAIKEVIKGSIKRNINMRTYSSLLVTISVFNQIAYIHIHSARSN
ncbi:tyrosine-protein phosphatase non-receptor type substrate 1-like [Scyliorhinus canicula]|uniref:tyrosine-protein phosphatase non-receptor type substrate 1-like n=1 Tax=Scyliorhinus canicula TaxID=7830 RepID=UPI0018F3233F|nr:tyrosine-protein phosphatase non-receptor type substrate 1-like [Scyliorhinus canicula]